jgi:hypothetical protein
MFLVRSATRELNRPQPGRWALFWAAVSWLLGAVDVLYLLTRTIPNDIVWAIVTAASQLLARMGWPLSQPTDVPPLTTTASGAQLPSACLRREKAERRRIGLVERRGTYYDAGWGDIDRTAAFAAASLQVFDDSEPVDTHNRTGKGTHGMHQNQLSGSDRCAQELAAEAQQLARTMKRRVIETTSFDMEPWPAPPSVERIVRGKGVSLHHGTFLSPEADVLCPAGCADWEQKRCLRDAHFVLMWPDECRPLDCFCGVGDAMKSASVKGVLILLPATGEQLHDERIGLGVEFAQRHGFATVSLTSPYYGHRSPAGQHRHFILNVADMLLQGHANPMEAATIGLAVLRATQQNTPKLPLVVSGFSFGGAMTACASAYMCGMAPPTEDRAAMLRRVVAVPYVGAGSPSVYLEGILQADMNWTCLLSSTFNGTAVCGPKMVQQWLGDHIAPGETKRAKARRELARRVLRYILRQLDTAKLAARLTTLKRNGIGGLHCVIAANDRIVPRTLGDELFTAASHLVAADGAVKSSLIAGGHVVAFLSKEDTLLTVIPEAIRAARLG